MNYGIWAAVCDTHQSVYTILYHLLIVALVFLARVCGVGGGEAESSGGEQGVAHVVVHVCPLCAHTYTENKHAEKEKGGACVCVCVCVCLCVVSHALSTMRPGTPDGEVARGTGAPSGPSPAAVSRVCLGFMHHTMERQKANKLPVRCCTS